MGVVKFDLKKDEMKFKDFSLNSIEDVYEFLNMLDLIYDEHLNGSIHATCIYVDFCKCVDSIDNNRYISKFIDIQIGRNPITQNEINENLVDIYDVVSNRLNIDKDEYLKNLHENILNMHDLINKAWLNNINSNYKNKVIQTEIKPTRQCLHVDESHIKEMDALRKYSYSNRTYQGNTPTDIKQLYEYKDKLKKEIKYLDEQKKKYYKKDKNRYFDYKEKAGKLKTFKIQVDKDIGILKQHYGISIGNQNQKELSGKRHTISYNTNNGEVLEAHDSQIKLVKLEQFDELMDNIYVGKIKKIGENSLTSRQYIIFELYYFVGLTQREIADMMGIPRENVTREIKTILNKIIKNI